MDDHLWMTVAVFIVYLAFALTEAAAQLLNKHKAQVMLESLRSNSALNRLLLPTSVGSLRSSLHLGKLIFLLSSALLVFQLDKTQWIIQLIFIILIFVFTFYLPFLISFKSPRGILKFFLPILRFMNIVLIPLAFPRDFLFNKYREKARTNLNDRELDETQQLEAYIDEAQEEGLFEPDEAALVRQVVEFSDTVVKEVMTPRVNIEYVNMNMTISNFENYASDMKFSRYPVIDEKIDNVVGVLHIKSILGIPFSKRTETTVAEIMTSPFYVPESKRVSNLLRDFQANNQQLAIVVDEYGGTAGIISLEDILEEIVGEIEDEHDADDEREEVIVENTDGSLTVSGNVDVTEVEKILDVELDDKSYETVSGLALSHLKHIPKVGETFIAQGGIKVEILEANERIINKVKLEKTDENE